jgi:hypothetical protein
LYGCEEIEALFCGASPKFKLNYSPIINIMLNGAQQKGFKEKANASVFLSGRVLALRDSNLCLILRV